jgi:hypothetical protein
MKRREFIASLLSSAVTRHVQAQQPAKVYRFAVVHPLFAVKEIIEADDRPGFKALFGELPRLGFSNH